MPKETKDGFYATNTTLLSELDEMRSTGEFECDIRNIPPSRAADLDQLRRGTARPLFRGVFTFSCRKSRACGQTQGGG